MFSCDTFAVTGSFYAGRRNFLAKNSDRPLGESQPLRCFPRKEYAPGSTVKCTHLTIPQVSRTYATLGCQPYWIWGFEMGVNECGLAIGNEAEFSRCDGETAEGLLGMDLLRLGLERAATAREAIQVITSLLERYGQNANAHPLRDRRYENSFMLCDPQEIWLLETAGRQWAARQVHDWAAISNCYSIGTNFDLHSGKLLEYAEERRWQASGAPFDFAKAYSEPTSRFIGSVPRWRRARKLIEAAQGSLDDEYAKNILRDHYEDELIHPQFGSCFGSFVSICMHAQTVDSSQTAGSLLVSKHEQLGIVGRYAPSVPCCSVYIPVYMTGSLPQAMERGGDCYDSHSLWWTVERLSTAISIDEDRFGPTARSQLRGLEQSICRQTEKVESQAIALIEQGKQEDANTLLNTLTQSAVEQVMTLADELFGQIRSAVKAEGGLYGQRMNFLTEYCTRVKMPLAD